MKLRVAFADPPYLRAARKHYGRHHRAAHLWDDVATHAKLIGRLVAQYPDGWALCCTSTTLRDLLPFCPPAVRVGAWVKPFCIFKPGVPVAYAWEPVIFTGGRPRSRLAPTVRDWVSANVTLRRGLPGAKPVEFCYWVFEILGLQPGDRVVDLFPGTRIVGKAFREFCKR